MKHLIYVTVLLVTAIPTAHAGAQEIRTCDFELKARCVAGDARVTLVDGVVRRVEVNVIWCGLPGRPGYTCTIDSSRDDGASTWSEEKGATLITNSAPFNSTDPDRVKVTIGRRVSIDMEEAQSAGRCGAGAALPRAIVIPAQKRACRVSLSTP
jgi:hypothetical protein